MTEEDLADAEADGMVEKLREEAKRIGKALNMASVLIICTRTEEVDGDSQTRRFNANYGNHYASAGASQAYLDTRESDIRDP
jgi:hypothetical protein